MQFDFSTSAGDPVFVGRRLVGRIRGQTFVKEVVGSKHQLRTPPAWAVTEEVFKKIQGQGVQEIEIRDLESGSVYRASVQEFERHCIRINRGGFEPQLALPLGYWSVDGAPAMAPGKSGREPARPGGETVQQLVFAGMGG